MPQVVGHEGEQPEHHDSGKPVPGDVADAAISAAEIHDQNRWQRPAAAATPASPDIRMPDQLPGRSSIGRPVLSAAALRNETTGRATPAQSAMPLEKEEIRFITVSRGCVETDFETENTEPLRRWSSDRRVWFNAPVGTSGIYCHRQAAVAIAGARARGRGNFGRIPMSVQMVLLPVFVLVGPHLRAAALDGRARRALVSGRPRSRISRSAAELAGARHPDRQLLQNQFELPLLFYILIALALPLRHADFVIVLLSWVFVVTRFAHAGIFVTSNDVRQRSTGMVRRRAGAVRDVGLFRAEDSVVDLNAPSLSNRKL